MYAASAALPVSPSRSLGGLGKLQSVRIPMGVTLSRARDPDNLGTNCWTTLDATTFSVRCGPNYRKSVRLLLRSVSHIAPG